MQRSWVRSQGNVWTDTLLQGYSTGGPRANAGPPIIFIRPVGTHTTNPTQDYQAYYMHAIKCVSYARQNSFCEYFSSYYVCPVFLSTEPAIPIINELIILLSRFFVFRELAKWACITIWNDLDSFGPLCHWIIYGCFSVSNNKYRTNSAVFMCFTSLLWTTQHGPVDNWTKA